MKGRSKAKESKNADDRFEVALGDISVSILSIAIEEGKLNVRFPNNGKHPVELDRLKDCVRKWVGQLKPPPEKRGRKELVRSLVEYLKRRGFIIRRVKGDIGMQVTVDTVSGRQVGAASRLHPHVKPNPGLEKSIFEAISRVGDNFRKQFHDDAEKALAAADFKGAAKAFISWSGTGMLVSPMPALADLTLARQIPVESLTPRTREKVLALRLRMALLLEHFEPGMDADLAALLVEFSGRMKTDDRASLAIMEGIIAQRKGYTATAIHHWKSALSANDSTRGIAHFHLSRAYPHNHEEAARHAEQGADAFLQSGDTKRAADCLRHLAGYLLLRDPQRALACIERALLLFGDSDPMGREVRAQLLHYKATALEKRGAIAEALEAAERSTQELADLLGAEQHRVGTLIHASHLAARLGDQSRAQLLEAEAQRIAGEITDPVGQLRQAAAHLVHHYDAGTASRLKEEAEAMGDFSTAAMIASIRASNEGTPEERLKWLEESLVQLRSKGGSHHDVEIVLLGIALALLQKGEGDLALERFQELLGLDPFHQEARQNIADLLMKAKRWKEAIAFFDEWKEIFGEKPGILYALGKAHLGAGNLNAAATALALCRSIAPADSPIRKDADKLLDETVLQGGQPDVRKKLPATPETVTHSEFGRELEDFAQSFQSHYRMRLWDWRPKKAHVWIKRPERAAQDNLGQFIRGRFNQRVDIFEEVAAGAGFIDLYIVGEGGFKAVLELKMLGRGYSSSYAFSGQKQIAHYMGQKKVSAGYLVLFDSRTGDFGKGLQSTVVVGSHIIQVLYVDVRPESPSAREPQE